MVRKIRIELYSCFLLAAFAAEVSADGNIINIDASDPDGMVVPIDEQELEANAETRRPSTGGTKQILVDFARFEQLVNDQQYDEADSTAKRLIKLAIDYTGPQSIEVATSLSNLAIIQHRIDQPVAAESNFRAAIEIIENDSDRLNSRLVNPLTGLAAVQIENGRADLASRTLGRAIHITHVNNGPHNMEQVELLHDLAEIALRMGDVDGSHEVQDTILQLNVHNYEKDSLEMVPALTRRADWYHHTGFIDEERNAYRRIVNIIEKELGRNDLALVDPLVKLGKTFFYADISGQSAFHEEKMSTAEVYFRRALRIAEQSADADWKIITEATLALGDYYLYANYAQHARQVYRSAWNLLSKSGNDARMLAMRNEELEQANVLREQVLPQYVNSKGSPAAVSVSDDGILQGTVTFGFGISRRGLPQDVTLIGAAPQQFIAMQEATRNELRRRIYRPVFFDGEAIATSNHVFVHTFYYRQSDLDNAHKPEVETVDFES